MSDDEVLYTKKQKIVHYGSLEGTIQRQAPSVQQEKPTSVTVTFSGPNINTQIRNFEIQNDGQTVERQSQLEMFEMRKKAKQIAVSTDDIEVRAHLRNLNHPMCK